MARFLLVHGASHGAWCWERVIPRLEDMGHSVDALDLPSHGTDDTTPPGEVSMDDYVSAVLDCLKPDTVLVGHSLGGLSVTLAAARAPQKIRALVYLCAHVPIPGKALAEYRDEVTSPEVKKVAVLDKEAGVSRLNAETAPRLFYHDCTEDDRAIAASKFTPQPLSIMQTVLEFETPAVPRHYIRCTDDPVILPTYQRSVSSDWSHVHKLACGHSPFFADPAGLTRILDRIAAEKI